MEANLSLRRSPEREAFEGLSVQEQLVMYEDMETDVQNHKGEVDRVVTLGRQLVEEIQSGKLCSVKWK